MTTPCSLQMYQPCYQNKLAQIFHNAVIELAPPFYNAAQIALWANFPIHHSDAFGELLLQGHTVIAFTPDDDIAGFGQLHPNNYVSLLYVSPHYQRQGIATTIYHQLETLARRHQQATLTVTASKLSQPLFEKMGFELLETEYALRNNIAFERYLMMKIL